MVDQQLSYNSYYGLMGVCDVKQYCDWHAAYTELELWSLMVCIIYVHFALEKNQHNFTLKGASICYRRTPQLSIK